MKCRSCKSGGAVVSARGLTRKCPKHPRYQAKRAPRTCVACWSIYLRRVRDEAVERFEGRKARRTR